MTLLGLPWSVHLVSFTRGVIKEQIENVGVLISNTGGTLACLFRGNAQVRNTEDPITRLAQVEGVSLSLATTLAGSCPRSASLVGALTTNQIGYTESVAAGRPLRPNNPTLEYGGIIQSRAEIFINKWIVHDNCHPRRMCRIETDRRRRYLHGQNRTNEGTGSWRRLDRDL